AGVSQTSLLRRWYVAYFIPALERIMYDVLSEDADNWRTDFQEGLETFLTTTVLRRSRNLLEQNQVQVHEVTEIRGRVGQLFPRTTAALAGVLDVYVSIGGTFVARKNTYADLMRDVLNPDGVGAGYPEVDPDA